MLPYPSADIFLTATERIAFFFFKVIGALENFATFKYASARFTIQLLERNDFWLESSDMHKSRCKSQHAIDPNLQQSCFFTLQSDPDRVGLSITMTITITASICPPFSPCNPATSKTAREENGFFQIKFKRLRWRRNHGILIWKNWALALFYLIK